MTLKDQAFTSVFWSAVERFSVQGGQIVIEIVLARLLMPDDYGLIAILGVFLAIAQTFIDGGFSNALIQKKDRNDVDYSTILYFNVFVALVSYLLLVASAPSIASFYNEPKLVPVAQVIGLNLIVSALSIVQRTKLMIALDFKRQALISFSSILLSGTCSITLAYNGWGVWALVWQVLINNCCISLLLWLSSSWKPLFVFSAASFKSLFPYGMRLLLASLMQTIYLNLYTIVIGKRFSSQVLGYYNRANVLSQVPSYKLTEIMTNAMFPIQCKIQDDDEKLSSSFISYLRMSCFIIYPLTLGLCALADPVVELVLTAKWLPMAPLLQLLCLAYMWTPVMALNHNLLKVKGRMDYFLRAEIIKKVVAVSILALSLIGGIRMLCAGLIFYSFADIFIITRYSSRVVSVTLMRQIRELFGIFAISLSMGVFVYCVQLFISPVLLKIGIGLLAGMSYYIGMAYICRVTELGILWNKVIKRKG